MRRVLTVAVSSLVLGCGYDPSACTGDVTSTSSIDLLAFNARGCATVTGRTVQGLTVNVHERLLSGPGREPRPNSEPFSPAAEGHDACILAWLLS
jgi:hypothetical protein